MFATYLYVELKGKTVACGVWIGGPHFSSSNSPMNLIFQRSVFVVGMVGCDGEGHLNEKSILLQGRYIYCFCSGPYMFCNCLIPILCLPQLTPKRHSFFLWTLVSLSNICSAFYSVEHSGGQCVRLDLHKLDRFSLFPGQVYLYMLLWVISSC